jgi:hypothetical protein
MKRNVEDSRIKGIEIGFNLCANNQKQLHDENTCSGTECAVEVPKGCKKGDHVGIFHTHASASSKPSIRDIANAYRIGMNCIGSAEEKIIKCYIRKHTTPTREGLENIIAAMIRYESPLFLPKISPEEDIKKYREWVKVRKDLKEHYLNTIDI